MNTLTNTSRKITRYAAVAGVATIVAAIAPATAMARGNQNGNHFQLSGWVNGHWQPLTCAQEQQKLDSEATSTSSKDKKTLKGLNILYSGIQNYVSTNNLNVSNYGTLNAAVTADQTKVTTDVNGIVAPQLSCSTNSTTGTTVTPGSSSTTTPNINSSPTAPTTSSNSTNGSNGMTTSSHNHRHSNNVTAASSTNNNSNSSNSLTSADQTAISKFQASLKTAKQDLSTYGHDLFQLFKAVLNG